MPPARDNWSALSAVQMGPSWKDVSYIRPPAHDLRLTPPNWIWLKGVDRTLFYALHRANTTKGFIEGAGVVAVARAEAEAMRFGLPCPEPCVDEAVEGLRRDMLSLGLIWDEPQPDRDRKRRILTNWSLTDDILPRTPATDNEF